MNIERPSIRCCPYWVQFPLYCQWPNPLVPLAGTSSEELSGKIPPRGSGGLHTPPRFSRLWISIRCRQRWVTRYFGPAGSRVMRGRMKAVWIENRLYLSPLKACSIYFSEQYIESLGR